jgi:Alginate export
MPTRVMPIHRIVVASLSISTVVSSTAVVAQPQVETEYGSRRPEYQSLRYEEDWSVLRDRSLRTDVWDPVKYLPLREDGWFLSLGGEGRFRYEAVRNAAFGSGPQDSNGYLLQRYLFHGDLRAGRHARVFTEIQSGLEAGRTGGPRLTDENRLEFHQAFVELTTGPSPRSLTLRVGRQEVSFGSGRLISASEGLNVRQSFDAIRPIVRRDNWTWNAMLAKRVATQPGIFDDGHVPGQTFGGLGFIRTSPGRPETGTSGYYLWLHRRAARFDQGAASERRHTLGSRTWGRWAEGDYNYEAIAQWGSFGGAPIRAWGLATDTGYLLRSSGWPTRIGIRADATTGDWQPDDPALHTFNPLFPGTAYSGRAGLVGPANSIDVTPSVRLAPTRRLTVTIDHTWFWRYSTHDGLYGIGVNVVRPGSESDARSVGRQLTAQADVRNGDHLTLSITFTAFAAGRFLRETPPGEDVAFVSVSSTYRF